MSKRVFFPFFFYVASSHGRSLLLFGILYYTDMFIHQVDIAFYSLYSVVLYSVFWFRGCLANIPYIFSPCRSLIGVNHFIVFETNRTSLSLYHSLLNRDFQSISPVDTPAFSRLSALFHTSPLLSFPLLTKRERNSQRRDSTKDSNSRPLAA